jgi:hypothetical protein
VGGFTQFRYVANFRSSEGAEPEKSFTSGFQNRRTQLILNGNIINPDLTFRVQQEFSRSGGGAGLLDAFGQYKMDNGWAVKWGQFKAPLLREELVSDTYQLAADRSIMNTVFTQGRTQGIELNYEADAWRGYFSFNDGLQTANTDFNSGGFGTVPTGLATPGEADWGLTARGEFKWAGDWKQFRDFTSWQQEPYAGMVGVAGHYQHGGGTGALGGSTTEVNVAEATIDASMEGNGWNAYAAAIYRHIDPRGSLADGSNLDDFGFLIQGGIFVSPQAELFARWDGVWADKDYLGDDSRKLFHEATVGVNYYFSEKSHAAKFTADAIWAFNETEDRPLIQTPDTAAAILPSSENDQAAVRLQFQLVF